MEMFASYEEVVDRISRARRFGKLSGVEVTKKMMRKIGRESLGIPFVHVAGTNGKGSVCAFLNSILTEAGWKVGVFTSPHLVDFEERIAINHTRIAKEDVARLGRNLLRMDFGVEPTMFDYCVLMALLYFEENHCDFAVIETGLGGRLDSTNALGTPLVSVITKIGLDHTEILGGNLVQIAGEKAGILKAGTNFVTERQDSAVLERLIKTAEQAGVNSIHVVEAEEIARMRRLPMKMNGVHQWENAAAAAKAADLILRERIAKDGERARRIEDGIAKCRWEGRMELVQKSPFLMVDGAHNGHGVHALAESLRALYPDEKFHFIMGVMADKDYGDMIAELLPLAWDFTTYTPESERALLAEELAAYIQKRHVQAKKAGSIEEILQDLSADEKNIAFGSLYFVGDIKRFLNKTGV